MSDLQIDPTRTSVEVVFNGPDGKPCPFVPIQGDLAKRYNGLSLILKDLEYAEGFFGRLLLNASGEPTISIALWFAGVITYAKCFTNSNDGRGTSLDAKSVFRNGPKGLQALHDEMLHTRHNYLAHGGTSENEQVRAFLILSSDKSQFKEPALFSMLATANVPVEDRQKVIVSLIAFVKGHVVDLRKSVEKRIAEECKEIPADELYAAATYPSPK